jgi:hypothetical protein
MKSMTQKVKGRATIRTAAVFFLASAVFEIMDFSSAVALFGGVRVGAAAVLYHFVFAALYVLSGIGMWTAKPWGYQAFMTTTAIYTIELRRSRHIGDFTKWKDHDSYQKAFDRLLRDLKAEKE